MVYLIDYRPSQYHYLFRVYFILVSETNFISSAAETECKPFQPCSVFMGVDLSNFSWSIAVSCECVYRLFLINVGPLESVFRKCFIYLICFMVKVKQVRSGPEGSRKLRFPDYMTTAHEGGKVVSFTHRPHLPTRKYSWY